MLLAHLERRIPRLASSLHEILLDTCRRDRVGRVAVHLDHFEEGLSVRLEPSEGPHRLGDLSTHPVRLTTHERGQSCRHIPALDAVISEAVRHEQCAQVRVAKAKRAI